MAYGYGDGGLELGLFLISGLVLLYLVAVFKVWARLYSRNDLAVSLRLALAIVNGLPAAYFVWEWTATYDVEMRSPIFVLIHVVSIPVFLLLVPGSTTAD